jgi:hypothetical protein
MEQSRGANLLHSFGQYNQGGRLMMDSPRIFANTQGNVDGV